MHALFIGFTEITKTNTIGNTPLESPNLAQNSIRLHTVSIWVELKPKHSVFSLGNFDDPTCFSVVLLGLISRGILRKRQN